MDDVDLECKTQFCAHCKRTRNVVEFGIKRGGISYKTCTDCRDGISAQNAEKRRKKDKENSIPANDTSGDNEDQQLRHALSDLTLNIFLDSIEKTENLQSFAAFVDLSPLLGENGREKADALAHAIYEKVNYRFM